MKPYRSSVVLFSFKSHKLSFLQEPYSLNFQCNTENFLKLTQFLLREFSWGFFLN